jgi:hypothetical protein
VDTRRGGFALVLAILALLLLTVLGLALAATTSAEMQIATNHRWDRQAFYSAEGGMAAGQRVLRDVQWWLVLPPARTVAWMPATATASPPTPAFSRATRNYEAGDCDRDGAGVGYGVVLDDGTVANPPYENLPRLLGRTVSGAVTLWVRRPLVFHDDGRENDEISDDVLVLTVEGDAPFSTGPEAARGQMATTVLEATLQRTLGASGWDVRVKGTTHGSWVCR